jgi:hypothetical protein
LSLNNPVLHAVVSHPFGFTCVIKNRHWQLNFSSLLNDEGNTATQNGPRLKTFAKICDFSSKILLCDITQKENMGLTSEAKCINTKEKKGEVFSKRFKTMQNCPIHICGSDSARICIKGTQA